VSETREPDRSRDSLADAREGVSSYFGWEADLAAIARGERDGDVSRMEQDQDWLLRQASASALVSIAESLAEISEALRHRPPTT
jgi:hypothetical protein